MPPTLFGDLPLYFRDSPAIGNVMTEGPKPCTAGSTYAVN
jgi:hypothetical protein